jgi:hypothetical protein
MQAASWSHVVCRERANNMASSAIANSNKTGQQIASRIGRQPPHARANAQTEDKKLDSVSCLLMLMRALAARRRRLVPFVRLSRRRRRPSQPAAPKRANDALARSSSNYVNKINDQKHGLRDSPNAGDGGGGGLVRRARASAAGCQRTSTAARVSPPGRHPRRDGNRVSAAPAFSTKFISSRDVVAGALAARRRSRWPARMMKTRQLRLARDHFGRLARASR